MPFPYKDSPFNPVRHTMSGLSNEDFSLTAEVQRLDLRPDSSSTTTTRPTTSSSSSRPATRFPSVGSWPLWTRAQISRAAFTISMANGIALYSRYGPADIKDVFEAAKAEMQRLKRIADSKDLQEPARFDRVIAQSMSEVVFGSNLVERVGTGLDETVKICNEIFMGQTKIELENIKPRTPRYAEKLEELIRKSVQVSDQHGIQSRREVVNHAAAFLHMTSAFIKEGRKLDEELVKETHAILVRGIDIEGQNVTKSHHYAGKYRKVPVSAGNNNFVVPHMVPKKMTEYFKQLNASLEEAEQSLVIDPFYIAGKACEEFVDIHPFLDGNGRICRLILNTILLKYAGTCAVIGEHEEERAEYIGIRKRAGEDMEGPGEFISFMIRKAKESLTKMVESLEKAH